MRLSVLTPPAEEPVSLAEAKAHLRLEISDDDAVVARLIKAARQRCEGEIARSFVTTGWRLKLDGFPSLLRFPSSRPSSRWLERGTYWGYLLPIEIPRADLLAVSAVSYVNTLGVTTTLSPTLYTVSAGAPGAVYPAYGTRWPATRAQPDALTVDFTAGYGTASSVPECLKEAILLLVGHLYEHREATTDLNLRDLPCGVCDMLAVEGWGIYA